MTELRWINVVIWTVLMAWSGFGGGFKSFSRHSRRGDPMRLSVFLTASIINGFTLRWLFIPDNDAVWQALYVGAVGDALFIAWLMRTYGRGERV